MSFTDTFDDRPEAQQLRKRDLKDIARSKGLPVKGRLTKADLLAVLGANNVTADFKTLVEAKDKHAAPGRVVKPVDIDAEIKEFTESIEKAPWFLLTKKAEEYGVEVPSKDVKDRAKILRQAIIEAALNG